MFLQLNIPDPAAAARLLAAVLDTQAEQSGEFWRVGQFHLGPVTAYREDTRGLIVSVETDEPTYAMSSATRPTSRSPRTARR